MPAVAPPITQATPAADRVRHSMTAVFVLGGLAGSALNFIVSYAAHRLLAWPTYWSVFAGTMANQLFHYVYYHLVFVNQEIRFRAGFAAQLLMYAVVASVAPLVTLDLTIFLHVPFVWALLVTLLALAAANVVLVRMSSFSSGRLAMIQYEQMDATFYDDQTDTEKVNFIRAWFHRTRFKRLTEFVRRHYRPGLRVADLGCGNCLWNVDHIPVIGVDANERMMRFAQSQGRLTDYRVTRDLSAVPLPDASQDLVILSETLEHLLNYEDVLRGIRRVIAPGGLLLLTVPADAFLGPFFIMFNVNCLYQGYVKGSAYHRYRCGHVNHFTRRNLRDTLTRCGFDVKELYVVNGLTLYCSSSPA